MMEDNSDVRRSRLVVGRSAFSFVNLMKPFVEYLRIVIGVRFIAYIDEILMEPSVGKASTDEDCWRES